MSSERKLPPPTQPQLVAVARSVIEDALELLRARPAARAYEQTIEALEDVLGATREDADGQ